MVLIFEFEIQNLDVFLRMLAFKSLLLKNVFPLKIGLLKNTLLKFISS